LRTNIHFAIGATKGKGNVIEITSTSPREGKTLTSTNLAIEIAKMGKTTLLIEADMRRPQIASLFKINEKPGLSDLLIETADESEAVRTITDILMGNSEWDRLTEVQGIDNLHIIPCGTIPPNPTELLLSNEFKKLIDKFREEYDFIIIDTPPTLPVSDSSIISPVVDGVVLVYQSDKTSRHLLLRAIQTLKKNRANLVGIVINQLSFDVILRSERGGYAYSYKQ
jgi:Mrp family chromosome partitioning ATPase